MVLILDGNANLERRFWVKSVIRYVYGIFLIDSSRKYEIYFKRPVLLHARVIIWYKYHDLCIFFLNFKAFLSRGLKEAAEKLFY